MGGSDCNSLFNFEFNRHGDIQYSSDGKYVSGLWLEVNEAPNCGQSLGGIDPSPNQTKERWSGSTFKDDNRLSNYLARDFEGLSGPPASGPCTLWWAWPSKCSAILG
jgi:hypothetical protein